MHRGKFVAAVVLGISALSLIGLELSAGPPDPPSGPVASSYKTLAEVEPRIAIKATNTPGDANSVFRITQSGSYYLAGDIAAPRASPRSRSISTSLRMSRSI
ncbi:MAG: hypothetical protein KJZ65_11815 [Phycisphaerales bacterium]|nr:hypothetical protein [Phycisphaerales bacterium]